MNTKSLLLLACLAPFALAPAVAATSSKPASTKAAPAKTAHASTKKVRRSRERVYTYKPRPSAGKGSKASTQPDDSIYAAGTRQPPFVGFAPTDKSQVGVGLWRMTKQERDDPNRTNPLRDPTGEKTRAAAVGVKLNF